MENLSDNELYGLDPDAKVAPVCPLKVNGHCPAECDACEQFAREMENK